MPSSDPASFVASLAHLYRIFRARPTMISQNDIAAWRDSELETCMPTDWYSIYLTSPIRQIYCTTTFADYCFHFADPSRIFRGHTTLHVKTVLYNPHTRTFRSMLIYIYIYVYIYICIYTYIHECIQAAHIHSHIHAHIYIP